MSYRRHFELLAALTLAASGCSDEFPAHGSDLVSDDGVYLVTLALPSAGLHVGDPAELDLSVEHDGELIDVDMPELHYEQHSGGSVSGSIDVEAGHMHGMHHAMHTFTATGDYELVFSFAAEDEHEPGTHDPDEDGGEEASDDAGAAHDDTMHERSEHRFEVTVQEGEGDTHGAAHMH